MLEEGDFRMIKAKKKKKHVLSVAVHDYST